MKKLLLLFLAMAGMVGTVSAAKLYVNVEYLDWWDGHVRVSAWGGGTELHKDFSADEKVSIYGKNWYVYEMTDGNTTAQIRYYNDNGEQGEAFSKTIDMSTDKYVVVWNEQDNNDGNNYKYGTYNLPSLRCHITGWSTTDANMEYVDNNTLSYVFTKTDIDNNTQIQNDGKIWFRIYNWGNQLYRLSYEDLISFAVSTTEYNNNDTNTDWSFGVTLPDYDYNNIVITAAYNTLTQKWTISADAYISKTIGTTGYSTFGSKADVDFSKAKPALTAAQKGKVGSDGKITWTDATTLKGGEGAMIQGTANQEYLIPVAATATPDTDNNDFVAITTKQQILQTMNEKYAYILVNGNDGLGFYKPNENGSWCAAGTAYLNTSVSPSVSSRGFFPLWDEPTAIENIESEIQSGNQPVFDLQGRRVLNTYKGIYIVNGKKVIIK